MAHSRTWWVVRVVVALCLLVLGASLLQAAQTRRTVLLLGGFVPYTESTIQECPLVETLTTEHGFAVGRESYRTLTREQLNQFNVVVIMHLPLIVASKPSMDDLAATQAQFDVLKGWLVDYVSQGGSLYLYGSVNATVAAVDVLNQLLSVFNPRPDGGPAILWEELRDPRREAQQPTGKKFTYAQAQRIATHPATAQVANWWYPVGLFAYHPLTAPLALNPDWTPLITTSTEFISHPLKRDATIATRSGATTALPGPEAVIYAARTYGKGRLILNGSESLLSFWNYRYSPYAEEQIGRIGMETGLNEIPSDGLKLLVSSLTWLADATFPGGTYGGYTPPAAVPFVPRVPQPLSWPDPTPVWSYQQFKGHLCCIPALGGGGGTGTVAEYAAAAAARELGFVVCAGYFAQMTPASWEQLLAECVAATTPEVLVVPGLITEDNYGNQFLTCGPAAWPQSSRLCPDDPAKVKDQLSYWMVDANFAPRLPFALSRSTYPAWAHRNYSLFPVATYEGLEKLEDTTRDFVQLQQSGVASRPVVMYTLTRPADLAEVSDFTYLQANDRAGLLNALSVDLVSTQMGVSSVPSQGPRVEFWGFTVTGSERDTHGIRYVPGTERLRATLKASSDVGLRSVTIYDHTEVLRRFDVTGPSCQLDVDLVRDKRHVLIALVEDVNNQRAITGHLESRDLLFWQCYCGDRSNLMGGSSIIRDAEGRERQVFATSQLPNAGWLVTGTVTDGEILPEFDGSGTSSHYFTYMDFRLFTTDPAQSETNLVVHQINRPLESPEVIILDSPVLMRSEEPANLVGGGYPYTPLYEPKVGAHLTQYHFYRNPVHPSPALAEMSMTITDPQGVTLADGGEWRLPMLFTRAWGSVAGEVTRYTILRADGSRVEGPQPDEADWTGRLLPGDGVVFPDIREGFFLLSGTLDLHVRCQPSLGGFHVAAGYTNTPTGLPAEPSFQSFGTKRTVRFLSLKTAAGNSDPVADFAAFRDAYGIGDGVPLGYRATPARGGITSRRYLLELSAEGYLFQGAIAQGTELPQYLPVKVTGLNEKWTAAQVDLGRQEWYPMAPWQGAAYTLVDVRAGDHDLLFANLVTTPHPDLLLTFLRDADSGQAWVDVHNPTTAGITSTISVPQTTFLALAQTREVSVPRGSTVRVSLSAPPPRP